MAQFLKFKFLNTVNVGKPDVRISAFLESVRLLIMSGFWTEQDVLELNVRNPNNIEPNKPLFGFQRFSDFGRSDFRGSLYL